MESCDGGGVVIRLRSVCVKGGVVLPNSHPGTAVT